MQSIVYIADSDEEVGKSIQFLLQTVNIPSAVFASANALLGTAIADPPGCVVAGAVLPDMSGVLLLNRLRQKGLQMPVIFLADSSDLPMAVEAMKSGAWDYFEKPFIQRVLLDSVQRALGINQK